MKRVRGAAVASLLLIASGCGGTAEDNLPDTVPANGYVEMDGEPLVGAQVVIARLDGENGSASALTDGDGYFELRAFPAKPGVVPGSYGVQVTKTVEEIRKNGEIFIPAEDKGHAADEGSGEGEVHWRNVLPQKYANFVKSGLVLNVPEGGNEDIKFELDGGA